MRSSFSQRPLLAVRVAVTVTATVLLAVLPCAADASEQELAIRGFIESRSLESGSLESDGPERGTLTGATVELFPVESRYDAAVRALSGDGSSEPMAWAETDERGRWQLTAPVGLYTLRIKSPLLEHEYSTVRLASDVYPAPLELPTPGKLRVTVVAKRGPIAGALVRLSPTGMRTFRWLPATQWQRTNDGGVAEFAVGDGLRMNLAVAAEGLGSFSDEVPTTASSGTRVELPAAMPRAVRVEDTSGTGVADTVLLSHEVPVAITDEQGLATVFVPQEGLRLEALAADGRASAVRIEAPTEVPDETGPFVVTLEPLRVVAGRVIDAESRSPISGALVWPQGSESFALTDGAGAYDLVLPPRSSASGSRVSAAAANHRDNTVDVPRDAAVAPTLALQPTAGLLGTVVNSDGEPLEGAEVAASLKAEGGMVRFGGSEEARTDEAGAFHIRGLEPGSAYYVKAKADGYAPGEVLGRAPEQDSPGGQAEPLEIVLGRGAQAFGRVVDESDQPIVGARVRLEEQGSSNPMERMRQMMRSGSRSAAESTSGPDGMFTFQHVAAGSYRMAAEAGGFAPASVPGLELVQGEAETDLGTLVLSPGVKVTGVVVDSQGDGLAGAQIQVRRQSGAGPIRVFTNPTGPAETTSGPGGEFEIVDLAVGEQVALQASLTGFQSDLVDGVRAPNEEPARIVLRKSAGVRGRVVDDTGLPLAGAEVGIAMERGMGAFSRMGRVRSTMSDGDGTFEMLDAPLGSVQITAEAEGFQEAKHGVELTEGQLLEDVELTLRPGARIVGTVTDSDGIPVVDARVALDSGEAGSNPMRRLFGSGASATDGDGRFVLDGVEKGRQTVLAMKDSSRVSRVLDVKPGTNRLDLRFTTGASVTGRVMDADGLAAIDVRLTLQATEDFAHRFRTTSRADGTFRFDDVAPGTYQLVGEAVGMASTRAPESVVVAAAPVSGLELRMDRGQVLVGHLLGVDFDDVANAHVSATNQVGFVLGEVDFEGGYRIEGLGPGLWTVYAGLADGRRATERVEIEKGLPETVLDLDFDEGESIEGEVVSESGPAQGVSVTASGLDVEGGGFAQTDTAGRFEFRGLDAGRYRITAADVQSGLSAEREVDAPGPDVLLELVSLVVEGRVIDGWDGSPVSGAHVKAEPVRDDPTSESGFARMFRGRSVAADDAGRFRLGGLTLGTWTLEVNKTGYAAKNQVVEVVDDGTTVEITLEPSEGLWLTVRRFDGATVPKLSLVALDAAGQRLAGGEFVPDDQSRVFVSTVPPGQVRLVAQAPGTAPAELDVRVPDDRPQVLLESAAQVEVEVPELRSDPARAEAVLQGATGRLRVLLFGAQLRDSFPLSRGKVSISGVPAGSWTVTVTTPDGRSWSGLVEVSGAGQAQVRLE